MKIFFGDKRVFYFEFNKMPKIYLFSVGGVFFAVCLLATGGIFVRLSEIDPIATGAWRVGLAMPFIWLWQKIERKCSGFPCPRLSLRQKGLFWLAGVFLGMDLTLWNISFLYTTVANANLLANLVPFFVIPVAYFLYGEKITKIFVSGLFLAASGVLILLSGKISSSDATIIGDALAAMTAVFYAAYLLVISRCRKAHTSATLMYWTGWGALSVLIPLAVLLEQRLVPQNISALLPLVGLALLSHTGGQGLLAQCLRYIPASLSSVLVLFQPVIAAVYAWIIFDEYIGPMAFLGGLVCLLGIFLANISKSKEG